MPEVAPMLIVGALAARVEAELLGGHLACPSCRRALGPWGYARSRVLRCAGGDLPLRPRRARCRGCAGTHVLLPDLCLLRRCDEVRVIGAALQAKAGGLGQRRIARELGLPAATVRGWLGRFAGRAEAIRAHFLCWASALDPELSPLAPAGSAVADALEAIAVAVRAFVLRFGSRPFWPLVASLSGGLLLATRGRAYPAVP